MNPKQKHNDTEMTTSSDATTDFEISIIEEMVIRPKPMRSPLHDSPHVQNPKHIGSRKHARLLVFVQEAAWQQTFDHAAANQHVEIGGLLLGEYYQDGSQQFVIVMQALPATLNDSYGGALVFTHRALIALDHEREQKFPELLVIGWYHSHPNFGIFYSAIDAHSHQTQFQAPFHVGLVVDPHRKEAGFFVWQDHNLIGPTGFWVLADTPATNLQSDTNLGKENKASTKMSDEKTSAPNEETEPIKFREDQNG